ncbi:hypothetical protein PHYBLDRAFT_143803 [Phycomyces blakesleeanus NRRL 1555(-)]|uniref:Uncharacterized protein n=1 Tax=Phycomyces blakesleeanus (strain ATCC 8743b / DSM 1359 / FGSC 10004 / NBRC 33097 / NRRL 1555) TaxID=763407 RepID=A0A162PYR9_PHYB8|nr:hypothetical protein PHYBLDRAFT_143803 [Phycomyces blakesleeanus NRRL 1555(-)]OAD75556.1 hypothetical protein PHYBLDRAFT_143803 [Phycomyces blakesleeanus NRRL 1555(-)]|eukprot:XP_018293596.1 hypothetical protein PHYBLDRAFT_143803 [Phycomyces blakesleeanus NRRL 1555(-)]
MPVDLNKAQNISKGEDDEDSKNDGSDKASESSESCKDQEEHESSTFKHSDISVYSSKRRSTLFGNIVKNTAKRSVKSIDDIRA